MTSIRKAKKKHKRWGLIRQIKFLQFTKHKKTNEIVGFNIQDLVNLKD